MMRTDTDVQRLRDALVTQRAWVQHWQQDAAHGLKPTENSLRAALATISDALDREAEAEAREDAKMERWAERELY